jgi:hypothetical protein
MLGVLSCLLLLLPASSEAYVRTMSETGIPLFWSNPNLAVTANPSNSSGLSQSQVQAMLGSAFSAWSGVPGTKATTSFNLSSSGPANSAFDGVNAVYFSSNSSRQLDWGVVGLTEVLYWVNSGQIAEADMVFNDRQFLFTATEGDTGKNIGGRTAIYLQDVATHEVGHAFGLDHTTVNMGSLVYTAFNGQGVLSADDKTGISTIYPSSGGRGALRGTVRGKNGGVFGTHLTAINLDTGKIQAGALANSDGTFRVGDLAPGNYAVMMESFGTGVSSISSYYSNLNHRFCSGSRFRRRFYAPCNGSGQVSVVSVGSGSTLELGTLAPSCSAMGTPGVAPTSIGTAKEIGTNGGAIFGTLGTSAAHFYRIRNASGAIVARALSYSLYSPADVRVEVLDSNGNAWSGAATLENVETFSGVTNYDSRATAQGNGADLIIRVSSAGSRVSSSQFPAGFDLVDADGHYLLALSVDGSIAATGPSDMSSCANLNNTSQSASFRAPASNSRDQTSGSGCGSLAAGPGDPPSQSGLFQILLGCLLVFSLARFQARLRRKLVRR